MTMDLAGCGPQAPGEPEGTTTGGASTDGPGGPTSSALSTSSAASTSTGVTTGVVACELGVDPNLEPPAADPAGCSAQTDEQACLALGDACVALYGLPLRCHGAADWCAPAPDAQTLLGCRPFAICKQLDQAVCTMTADGVQAFWTRGCVPMGFGPCVPGLADDAGQPPPCPLSP